MLVLPIGDEGRSPIVPWVNYLLIGANVYAFFAVQVRPPVEQVLIVMRFGLVPSDPRPIAFITSLFLHGDLGHLLGNMLYLYVVGHRIEETLGRVGFVVLYLASGVLASTAHVAGSWPSNVPCVGASGAIAGMLGIYLVFFPRTRIRFWYWVLIFFWGTFRLPALVAIGFWFVEQLLLLVREQSSRQAMSYVAYWAHVGGFVFGVAGALAIRSSRVLRLSWVKAALLVPRAQFAFDRDGGRLAGWTEPSGQAAEESAGVALDIEDALARGRVDAALAAYLAPSMQAGTAALSPSAQIRVGNELYLRGRIRQACEAYERFLNAYPDGPWTDEVMFRVGYLYGEALHNGPAAAHYLRHVAARSLDPRRAMQARAMLDRMRLSLRRREIAGTP